jgi:hypothetical protein
MANHRTKTTGTVRAALWVVLATSLAGNAATSGAGGPLPVSIALGLVALASGVALAMHHYRHR